MTEAAGTRIDIYDFCRLFADARSFAVVGNAATILDYDNGARIDGHDVVVRFNRAQTRGLEGKIGTRTDLLVANELNSLDIAPSPAQTLKPRCVLSFSLKDVDFDVGPFRAWVGPDIPTLCSLPPDIVGFEQSGRTRLLTQGTYALYILLKLLRVERLFLTGFTMFGAAPGGARKYYGPKKLLQGTYHDLDEEVGIFCQLLESFGGQLDVTDEVAALLRDNGYRHVLERHGARPAATRSPGLAERARARLAWRLLKLAVRLRRSVEKSTGVVFEDIKK